MIPQINQVENYRKFIKKIFSNRQITIMFFGGSITEGATTFPSSGVNIDGKTFAESFNIKTDCWREITYKWLKNKFERFPGQFRQVNAAIGGTGSLFGAIRFNDHVAPYRPDLIFIDFAVNDNGVSTLSQYQPYAKKSLFRSIWSIIKRLYELNPDIAIFMPLTTFRKAIGKQYTEWTEAMKKSAELYKVFCNNFRIPYLSVYDAYYNNKLDNIQTVKLYMGEDSPGNAVHPSKYGHKIIAQSVCNCLDKLFDTYQYDFSYSDYAGLSLSFDRLTPYPVSPVFVYPESFISGPVIVNQAKNEEYIEINHSPAFSTKNIKDSFTYKFKGEMIGAWFDYQSACSIEIRVNNRLLGCWTCNSTNTSDFGNEQYAIFADNLDPIAEHVLEMRPSKTQSLLNNLPFMWGIKALFIDGQAES